MIRLALLVILLAVPWLAQPASAQTFECGDRVWSGGHPAVNLRHIFCGEIRRKADGYHSQLFGSTAVVDGVSGIRDAGHGLYSGLVHFRDGETKFSSFYPRYCSVEQIVRSVRFAAAQPRHLNQDHWSYSAPSAPTGAGPTDGYCLDSAGDPFPIRYGVLTRGDVNTAFPDIR